MTALEFELFETLKLVNQCLAEHLSQDAHDKNVTVHVLCPCWDDQLTKAKELIDKVVELIEEDPEKKSSGFSTDSGEYEW